MKATLNPIPDRRLNQRGGIAILTVFGLLVLMTVLAFGLSKNAIREVAVTGTAWQAAKASEAAEAGTDWFILWSNKENWSSATSRGRDTLVKALGELNATNTWRTSGYLCDQSLTDTSSRWDRASQVTSSETDTASDMVFTNSGAGYQQSTPVQQSFDVMFRYLGQPLQSTVSSGTGNPSGGTTTKTGTSLNLYQIQSVGKASIPIGSGSFMRYRARREVYVTTAP